VKDDPHAEVWEDATKNSGEIPVNDLHDSNAYTKEQASRASKLFSAIVLAALDDAVADQKKSGKGVAFITRWARSRDGRQVLSCAGIEPTERVVQGLVNFVCKGNRTSCGLSRQNFDHGQPSL
jgi:hypothetical protein